LRTTFSSFTVAGLDLLVELVERDLGGLRHLGLALLVRAGARRPAGLLVVLHRDERVAGLGHAAQAEDLDRRRRPGVLDPLPLVVHHGADATELRAAHERIAGVERALLDENGRDRSATAIEARLDDGALREPSGVRLQFEHVRLQDDHVEELRDAVLRLRGDRDHDRVAAPLLGGETVVAELLLHALGVRVRLVDFVDRDEDGHLGGPRVIDRLDRLRHHAVVGGDDEDDDVGHLRAARAHRGERLVARRVEEGHLPAVHLDRCTHRCAA
jgi:hypothetical protein